MKILSFVVGVSMLSFLNASQCLEADTRTHNRAACTPRYTWRFEIKLHHLINCTYTLWDESGAAHRSFALIWRQTGDDEGEMELISREGNGEAQTLALTNTNSPHECLTKSSCNCNIRGVMSWSRSPKFPLKHSTNIKQQHTQLRQTHTRRRWGGKKVCRKIFNCYMFECFVVLSRLLGAVRVGKYRSRERNEGNKTWATYFSRISGVKVHIMCLMACWMRVKWVGGWDIFPQNFSSFSRHIPHSSRQTNYNITMAKYAMWRWKKKVGKVWNNVTHMSIYEIKSYCRAMKKRFFLCESSTVDR